MVSKEILDVLDVIFHILGPGLQKQFQQVYTKSL